MSLCGKLRFNASTRDPHKPVDAKTMFRDIKEMRMIMANLLWMKLEGKSPRTSLKGRQKAGTGDSRKQSSGQVGLLAFPSRLLIK